MGILKQVGMALLTNFHYKSLNNFYKFLFSAFYPSIGIIEIQLGANVTFMNSVINL